MLAAAAAGMRRQTQLAAALLLLLLLVSRGDCSRRRPLQEAQLQAVRGSNSNSSSNSSSSSSSGSASVVQPDYGIYLHKTDLLAKVRQVVAAHPGTMKYETRHAADGDYKADIMVVTVEPAGLSPTHKLKARLLLDFGEHGREFISSEVGLRLLEVLGDADALSKLVGGGRRAARLQAILQHTAFKILPMENTAGRDMVEAGKLCERKNGRGVDPNRNWDIDWGVKEKDYDPNEEFPGKAPLSEPETQVVLGVAKELKPHVWLNVHSGMYALFTPYDHKNAVPNTTDARAAMRMLERIKGLLCPQCAIGSGGHTVGYLAHGTATDYMFEVLKVPMAFTWEIYGDESARYDDCFRMFNPLGRPAFDDVVGLWTRALLTLLELLPTHPATWPLFRDKGLDRWEAVLDAKLLQPAAAGAAAAAATGVQPAGTPGDAASQQQQQQPSPLPAVTSPSAQPQQQPEPQQQHQEQQQQQEAEQEAELQAAAERDAAAAAAAATAAAAAAAAATQPATTQQQQAQDGIDSSSSSSSGTEVSIQQQGDGLPASSGGLAGVVSSKGATPLMVGLAGLGLLVYLILQTTQGRGPAYSRLSALAARERLPVRR